MGAPDSTNQIHLDHACPGMTLAEAVLDKAGTRLMSAGAALTKKSIDALRQRGVQRIYIVQAETGTGSEQSLSLAQALDRLDVLFGSSRDSAPNRFLHDCLRSYRTRTMQ